MTNTFARIAETVSREALPSEAEIQELMDRLRILLFPELFRGASVEVSGMVRELIDRCLQFAGRRAESGQLADALLRQLPAIRQALDEDVQAALKGDPATENPFEIIACYPGIRALLHYRIAHALFHLEVPLLPRMIAERAHSVTGIDIHPGARLGNACFIDHGTGIVIGATAIVGDRVSIYQGVTLGAKSFPRDAAGNILRGQPRHPIVEDDVTLYAGATVLGRVTIGRGSIIGSNVCVSKDLPPGSRVVQAKARNETYEGWGDGI